MFRKLRINYATFSLVDSYGYSHILFYSYTPRIFLLFPVSTVQVKFFFLCIVDRAS